MSPVTTAKDRRDYCREWSRQRMASDPERHAKIKKAKRDSMRKQYGSDPEYRARALARNREWYHNHKGAFQALQKIAAGITALERELIVAEHGDYCDICGTTTSKARGWHLDHDHKTGKIRGVLCQGCNTGLGLFQDSPRALRLAAEYLEKTS